MRTRFAWLAVAGAAAIVGMAWQPQPSEAQPGQAVMWIWFNEGNPAEDAPAETRYFRRVFKIDRPTQIVVDEAELDITADNAFTVWVNGAEVGRGTEWQRVYRFDVRKHLVQGDNVIAVEAKNTEGPAGLLVRLGYVPNGQDKRALASNDEWKASKTAAAGWQKVEFDDKNWTRVKVIGPYGKAGPWRNVVWDKGGNERFSVTPGFAVEQVIPTHLPLNNLPYSFVNMTFDAKGRLLLSQERGPIVLCTDPDPAGVRQKLTNYCEQVKNCQGMCWVKDSLLLVGDGPQGTGLYRVKDTDGDDKTDEVKLLHRFQGGMGEHGPHAIIHGPDGWLYLVIGNHAWAQIGPEVAKNGANPEKLADNSPLVRWPTGRMGPDQDKPNTTEDVLLPRLNDSRGHAANILAPGGTIWRLDHDGKNMSLVTAGFRNHYDAAFNPAGELFTFDSDMEWDEALPWYRAVRVCHCTPGADFVWRTGAANTPNYYLDSLPPTVETGRGSPVGVEFYDHEAFPSKYRGAFFMADWAIGVIFAVHLERDGATYKGKAEKFCVGTPMNVTDCIVGPDGALYFSLGGRGTQGGVFRIVHQPEGRLPAVPPAEEVVDPFLIDQPLAAWSRATREKALRTLEALDKDGKLTVDGAKRFAAIAENPKGESRRRIDALNALLEYSGLDPKLALKLAADREADVRAHAVWLLGVIGGKKGRDGLLKALTDDDSLVRRRACEALIRAGIEPPVEAIWPLMGNRDQFVRTAARLVLERIDPEKWVERLWREQNQLVALHGIVALCKIHQAAPYTEDIFVKLFKLIPPPIDAFGPGGKVPESVLDAQHRLRNEQHLGYVRTLQLVLVHTKDRPEILKEIVRKASGFPSTDKRLSRELAILRTYLRKEKLLTEDVHRSLLDELLKAKEDRQQQIHYFYCIRLLHEGWTPEQKQQLLAWYDSTRDWTGGHSFTPFLENILRDLNPVFTKEDRTAFFSKAAEHPFAAAVLLKLAPADQLPSAAALADFYIELSKTKSLPRLNEIKENLLQTLGKVQGPEVSAALRRIADTDPAQRDAVARLLLRHPSEENWPYLIRALNSTQQPLLVELTIGLKKLPQKPAKIPAEPKPEDAAPWRVVLLASTRIDPAHRWKVVELLRHWSGGRDFGANDGDWKPELEAWSRWFAQTFPKQPALPNVGAIAAQSKWKFDDLRTHLETGPGKTGDVAKGRVVFEKANCLKCHKFGKEGEGIGPDLTTLRSRFKRTDTLEALLYPSKVISDQYRGTTIMTKAGLPVTGLAAVQGDTVTVLQQDGTKVTLKKDEIDRQFASTISPMPEKLLDELTLQEIADLFAYMESEPGK